MIRLPRTSSTLFILNHSTIRSDSHQPHRQPHYRAHHWQVQVHNQMNTLSHTSRCCQLTNLPTVKLAAGTSFARGLQTARDDYCI